MPSTAGVVTEVERKTTKTGKPYVRVRVGDTWYSLWEPWNFAQGDSIEFDVIQKGDFLNMAKPRKAEEIAAPAAGNTVRTRRPDGSFDPDREARIVRQNAFSTAAALVASWVEGQKQKPDIEAIFTMTKELAKKVFRANMEGYDAPVVSTVTASPAGPADEEFFK